MSRNKTLIGSDNSQFVQRADEAMRARDIALGELTMIRRRIRTFFAAVTQVRFPASPPSWAEDWPEWLETGEIAPRDEETVEELTQEQQQALDESAEMPGGIPTT
jgi:nucleotide-binding universal stress UspA family protein